MNVVLGGFFLTSLISQIVFSSILVYKSFLQLLQYIFFQINTEKNSLITKFRS